MSEARMGWAGKAYAPLRRAWRWYRSHQRGGSDGAEKAGTELAVLAQLVGSLSAADWQGSTQALLNELVNRGYANFVKLVGSGQDGVPEVRGWSGGAVAGATEPGNDPELRRLLGAGRLDVTRGRVFVPVETDGHCIGGLVLTGPTWSETGLGQEQLWFLRGVAGLTALALAGWLAFQNQAALSRSDGLTGLANHRHLHHLLATVIAQSYLDCEPLSIILLDIDDFKRINDTYGHLFGDLVLREVAKVLRRSVPEGAILSRYGGEEFAVVLSGAELAEATVVAERLRQDVAAHQVREFTTGALTSVTISLGVAEYELGTGKSRLIARADEALYASKRTGRNRVTRAEPTEAAATGVAPAATGDHETATADHGAEPSGRAAAGDLSQEIIERCGLTSSDLHKL